MQKSKQFIKKFKQLVEEIQIFSFQRSSLIFTSFPVILSTGSHPFPSRTRKLSLLEPMILHGYLCGKVGSRRIKFKKARSEVSGLFYFCLCIYCLNSPCSLICR